MATASDPEPADLGAGLLPRNAAVVAVERVARRLRVRNAVLDVAVVAVLAARELASTLTLNAVGYQSSFAYEA